MYIDFFGGQKVHQDFENGLDKKMITSRTLQWCGRLIPLVASAEPLGPALSLGALAPVSPFRAAAAPTAVAALSLI